MQTGVGLVGLVRGCVGGGVKGGLSLAPVSPVPQRNLFISAGEKKKNTNLPRKSGLCLSAGRSRRAAILALDLKLDESNVDMAMNSTRVSFCSYSQQL